MTSVAEKLQRKSQRGPSNKQVRLKLVYIDFWSVVKLSFLISLCLGIVLVVATFLIWIVLDSTHVFSKLDTLLQEILTDPSFHVTSVVGLPEVTGFAFVIAILDTIVGTAIGAIAALLYNLSVRITGGLLVGFTNQ